MTKLQYAGLVVAAVLGGWFSGVLQHSPAEAQAGKTLEAEEFVLKGKDGKVKAKISVDETGSGSVQLFDSEGKLRATLANDSNDNYGLRLNYKWNEKGGAHFTAGRDNDASLAFYNNEYATRLRLYLGMKNDAGMEICRHDGKAAWRMEAFETSFWANAFAKDYSKRFELDVSDDKGTTLSMMDSAGSRKWTQAVK
jgi:hypothetical protein